MTEEITVHDAPLEPPKKTNQGAKRTWWQQLFIFSFLVLGIGSGMWHIYGSGGAMQTQILGVLDTFLVGLVAGTAILGSICWFMLRMMHGDLMEDKLSVTIHAIGILVGIVALVRIETVVETIDRVLSEPRREAAMTVKEDTP